MAKGKKAAAKAADVSAEFSAIVHALEAAHRLTAEQNELNEKREGVYTQFTRVAATMGKVAFEKACDTVFDAVRTNKGGLATRLGAKPGKAEGTFLVHPSAMAAKSRLLAAFTLGIAMVDEDGETPRPFSVISAEVKKAQDALAAAERTPAEVLRDDVAADLAAFAAEVRESEEPGVNQVQTLRMIAAMVAKLRPAYVNGASVALKDEEPAAPAKGVKAAKAAPVAAAKAA
jgi:hypothetical protein